MLFRVMQLRKEKRSVVANGRIELTLFVDWVLFVLRDQRVSVGRHDLDQLLVHFANGFGLRGIVRRVRVLMWVFFEIVLCNSTRLDAIRKFELLCANHAACIRSLTEGIVSPGNLFAVDEWLQ